MNMQWFWTWSGKSFGYRIDDNLFTHYGMHMGKFYGDEIYDQNGQYLGEVKNKDRVISDKSKKSCLKSIFAPKAGYAYSPYANYGAYGMYASFEDFPLPESFIV